MTTDAQICQQQPQLSRLQDDCDSSVAAAADPGDMNELSSLLVLYNHDLDRVQRHLDGALQHTKTQQDQLQLSRMAQLEARKQVRFSWPGRAYVHDAFYFLCFCISAYKRASESQNAM